MNSNEISVVPVNNGWLLYVRDPSKPGTESPRYVFNDAREMANAIHELVVRGTLDPIQSFKPFSQYLAEHKKTPCYTH